MNSYEADITPIRTGTVGDSASARERERERESERPVTAIVTDLWERTELLVRQELKYGLAEAQERVDALKGELLAKASAGVILLCGLLTIVASLTLLLSLVMSAWLAALIVGGVLSCAGFALLQHAHSRHQPNPNKLEETRHGNATQ